jgi:hypothetical protein
MMRIAAASSILVALALNSAIGLAAPLLALVGRNGLGGLLDLAAALASDAIATRFHNAAMRPPAGAALLVVGAILAAGGPRP